MKNSDEKRLLVIRNCGESGKYRFTPLSPGDLSEIHEESFDLPFLHSKPEIYFNSCGGLLCIYEYGGHIYVLNPKTKRFQFFPTEEVYPFNRTSSTLIGACVCYDSKSDDYKILRVCDDKIRLQTFELYSFEDDSWNQISRVPPFKNIEETRISGFKGTSVRGKCYWFTERGRIVSLDCSEKTLSYIDLPPGCQLCHTHSFRILSELVQFNGGDSLGVVRLGSLQPEPGNYYELWVWGEELKRWDRKFSVSLGGAVGRPPGTIYATFLFLRGMAGNPDEDEYRLVAYEWTKRDCKELGIHNHGFPIHVLCYVESTVALPHGTPIVGSGFLNHPPVVEVQEPDWLDNYCDCDCHDDDSTEDSTDDDSECKCCRGYTDAHKIDIEDFADNGFRVLNNTKKQSAFKPMAGNPDSQGNISRHDHVYEREEGELNVCSDMFPMVNRLLVGSIQVLVYRISQQDPESSAHHLTKTEGRFNICYHNPYKREGGFNICTDSMVFVGSIQVLVVRTTP
ncbi:uncharacterized protein LOC131014839 [Salvia miltiorrhiza]|uniref:uncharacterized protein LOC131014839 n=1 Tax=Salvia miltiorrhiza TaxID=226208 RepID=UPI0025ACC0D0|nr:uncharacterized protein LOC131014839 [Salvia miltiorrhiza]